MKASSSQAISIRPAEPTYSGMILPICISWRIPCRVSARATHTRNCPSRRKKHAVSPLASRNDSSAGVTASINPMLLATGAAQ